MKRRGKRWLAAVLVLLVGIALLFSGKGGRQRSVELRFHLARGKFEAAAQSMLESDSWENFLGVGGVNVWECQERPGERVVTFSMGGWGLGSETAYHGVYTTTDKCPASFQGTGYPLTAQGEGWSWKEPSGDNRYYTEEIVSGWYYYVVAF